VKNQIAWHFKKEIPDEEDSRRDCVLLAGEAQVLVHRQRRKPNVDAVDHGHHVKREDKRNQPDLQFSNCSGLDEFRGSACIVSQCCLFSSLCRAHASIVEAPDQNVLVERYPQRIGFENSMSRTQAGQATLLAQ
jgi:hypothetical protein